MRLTFDPDEIARTMPADTWEQRLAIAKIYRIKDLHTILVFAPKHTPKCQCMTCAYRHVYSEATTPK